MWETLFVYYLLEAGKAPNTVDPISFEEQNITITSSRAPADILFKLGVKARSVKFNGQGWLDHRPFWNRSDGSR